MTNLKEQLDNSPIIISLTRNPKNKLEKRFWNSSFWKLIGLFRPRRTYKINVSRLSMVTFHRIASEIVSLSVPKGKMTNDYFFQVAAQNTETLARIIALAIWNRRTPPPIRIERWLKNNLSLMEFAEAFQVLRDLLPVEPFLQTLSCVRSLSMLDPTDPIEDKKAVEDGTQV
jgi:hypothetical protein